MDDRTVLALDTSHMKGSAAVTRGEDILCEIVFDASDTHSATLMPALDACLRMSGTALGDVDLFAVVAGPGSFTGLRIGLATIKAFAAVGKKPVTPLSSLEVLAAALPFAKLPVMPMIDARRGEVYAAVYDTSAGFPAELAAPRAMKPSGAGPLAAGAGARKGVLICGTGSLRYRKELSASAPAGSLFAAARWSIPSAAVMAFLASKKDPVAYSDLPGLEPVYIRPPDAKLPSGCRLRPGGGG